MSHAYVIEINEEAVGLVVRQLTDAQKDRGYRFYASTPPFRVIEGKVFGSPSQAYKAAVALRGKELSRQNTNETTTPV